MNDAKEKEQAHYSTLAGMFLFDRMMINGAIEVQKDGKVSKMVLIRIMQARRCNNVELPPQPQARIAAPLWGGRFFGANT